MKCARENCCKSIIAIARLARRPISDHPAEDRQLCATCCLLGAKLAGAGDGPVRRLETLGCRLGRRSN